MTRINRRLLAFMASLVLATLAAFALLSYVRGVEVRSASADENVIVLFAEQQIPAGTTAEMAAEQGWLDTRPIPRRVVATGAIGGIEPLAGLVATTDIYPGEQVILTRFAPPDEARGFLPIPEGLQAMTVEVGVPPGVAGFIRAGDRISIIAQLDVPDEEVAGVPDEAVTEDIVTIATTRYLLQDIHVLSASRRVIVQGEESVQQPEDRVLLTLALDALDAEQLAHAIFNGSLYATLLPDDASIEDAQRETPGRTLRNAFEAVTR